MLFKRSSIFSAFFVGIILCQLFEIGHSLTQEITLGSAPFCKYGKSKCETYNMKLLKKIKSNCVTGKKIVCQLNTTESSGDSSPNTFNLLTYNIFARPYLATHDGQKERICRIPETLSKMFPEVDAVILQESFISNCVQNIDLQSLAKAFGWTYSTPTVGAKAKMFNINGGVSILSRWPIEKFEEYIFKHYDAKTADALSNKGVAYAKINKNGQYYHVFGTHLQAEDGVVPNNVRVAQLKEMSSFIKLKVKDTSARVLFGGDFNLDKIRNKNFLSEGIAALNGKIPEQSEHSTRKMPAMKFTYDGKVNDLVEDKTYPASWFDYVGYLQSYVKPTYASMTAYHMKNSNSFAYCSAAKLQPWYVDPKSKLCISSKHTMELSDHFPVLGIFKYN